MTTSTFRINYTTFHIPCIKRGVRSVETVRATDFADALTALNRCGYMWYMGK